MKSFIIVVCFIIATPFVLAGAFWSFIKDAFRVGKEFGTAFIEYLSN